jgi:hypothetical protein
MDIIVAVDGTARFVYDETLDLTTLGSLDIRRASHVEPTDDGRWTADLSPVDGPSLGPFTTRSEALLAEQAWLAAHWLTTGVPMTPASAADC